MATSSHHPKQRGASCALAAVAALLLAATTISLPQSGGADDRPAWMTVGELIRYSRAFYPRWDDAYAEELRQAFTLDAAAKIKTMSK